MIKQIYKQQKFIIYISLFLSLLTCLVELTIYGELGTKQYAILANQYNLLSDNVEKLKHLNKELALKKKNLETNTEDIILAARKVGYYERTEKRIIISGLKPTDKELEIGRLFQINTDTRPRSIPFILNFIILSLLYFFIIYFIILITAKPKVLV